MGQQQDNLVSFSSNHHWHKYDKTLKGQMLKNKVLVNHTAP